MVEASQLEEMGRKPDLMKGNPATQLLCLPVLMGSTVKRVNESIERVSGGMGEREEANERNEVEVREEAKSRGE